MMERSKKNVEAILEQLSIANTALQEMIDVFSNLSDPDNFVPVALRIVAKAFRATDCAYYEHRRGDPIRLKYWFFRESVLAYSDIMNLDDSQFGFMKHLAEGFTVPDTYLGVPFRLRTRASVVDHAVAVPSSVFDEYCCEQGWNIELNVPLVVAGEADGALLIYRGAGTTYTEAEISLAERLGQQLNLAIEVGRSMRLANDLTAAHERELAAVARSAEISRANEVLKSTVDQLSAERNLSSFPRAILKQAMDQLNANDGLILIFDKDADILSQAHYICAQDETLLHPSEFSRPFPASRTRAWNALLSKRAPIVFDIEVDTATMLPGLLNWHRSRGNRCVIAEALFMGSEPYGYFGITMSQSAENVSAIDVGLIHALTQLATLAIQLNQLADQSQQVAVKVERQQAVAQERATMAREIHDKLAQGYAAILFQQYAMRQAIGAELKEALPYFDSIERLSKENIALARRTMDDLRVDPFGPSDLKLALENIVDEFLNNHDFVVELIFTTAIAPIPHYVETEVCRIVCEALTNAYRHSRAKKATVTVERSQSKFLVSIEDRGVGFDGGRKVGSFGILGMHERAARAGADLVITSVPTEGTVVKVMLAKHALERPN